MEKLDRKQRESDGVLGQLYKQVKDKEQEAIDAFIRQDYEKSILLDYNLDEKHVEYAKQYPDILKHLKLLYNEIVNPMDERLKHIVIKLGICSESEIFASNLEFRVFQNQEYQQLIKTKRAKKREHKADVKKLL